jgi:hypothetical protein
MMLHKCTERIEVCVKLKSNSEVYSYDFQTETSCLLSTFIILLYMKLLATGITNYIFYELFFYNKKFEVVP